MMNNIVLITGMAGSGKSTISRLVAEHFSKSLHLQVDDLGKMMVKGKINPSPDVDWTDELIHQFQMVRSTAIHMACLYASQGVDVVVDDVCVPPNFVEQYAPLFEIPTARRVLLYPKVPALIERIKQRGGTWDHILVDLVPKVYRFLDPMPKDGWIVLDSGEWTIERTLHEVLTRIGAVPVSAQS